MSEEMNKEMNDVVNAEEAARELFYKRNERAAIHTLWELERAAGAKPEQTPESVLDNLSVLVSTQREEFGARQCRYVPLAVMRNVWVVKTAGHGRELSEETEYLKDSDTVAATVVLGDGFGGEYKTKRERPVDRSGFDTEVAQILRSIDLIRGTAWSACYASVQANNGYAKVYLDDTAPEQETASADAPKAETVKPEDAPKKRGRKPKKTEEPVDALADASQETGSKAESPATPVGKSDPIAEKKTAEVAAAPKEQTEEPKKQEVAEKTSEPVVWPEKPLHEVSYEEALATVSPFVHWKLSVITGIGEKPGTGNRNNAVMYIEKALSVHGETFDSPDVNAMLTIIMHNDDMKAAYDKRRAEIEKETA